MAQYIFILNPAAGKGSASAYIPEIKKNMQKRADVYEILTTKSPGHATEIAKQIALNSFNTGDPGDSRDSRQMNPIVIALGGDGTIYEVINGLIGSAVPLGIIPCGSGNDFARSLTASFENILERTLNGSVQSVDIMKINDAYSINISSVGFDAEVVFNMQKFKNIPFINGKAAYILGILYSTLALKKYPMTIQIDDEQFQGAYMLVAIANGKYYGGGMQPAPEALIDDGLLDICLVRSLHQFKLLKCFPMLMKGTHGQLPEVSFYKGKHIVITGTSNDPLPINMDGEVLKDYQLDCKIIPAGIQILIPDPL